MPHDFNTRPGTQDDRDFDDLSRTIDMAVQSGASLDEVLTIAKNSRAERGHADEDLAMYLDGGVPVLAAVDVGTVFDEPFRFGRGEYNGLVWVLRVDRDDRTGRVSSVAVSRLDRRQPVDIAADRFLSAWLSVGGWIAVAK
jgi:hypothetical protein